MKATLVLLHGFTQTGAAWAGVRSALGERYTALAPDLRGHGRASEVRPVSFEACIADIAALADGPLVLAGYSMGGRLALSAALAMPERVERLILIGATAGIEDQDERAARRASDFKLADEIEAGGVEAFARRWGEGPLFSGQPPAVAAAAAADRLRSSAAGLAASLRGMGTGVMEPLWGRLPELGIPVIAAAGERDAKFRAIAQRLAAAVPQGRAEVIAGAGHAAHLEQPEAVARLIEGGTATCDGHLGS